MFRLIKADMLRKAEWYGLPPTAGSILRMCFSDGSNAQIIYRAMQFCQNHRMKILAAILYRMNGSKGHVTIGRGAEFGPGLVIMHSFGIVVHGKVRGGCNVTLENNVTIGEEKNLTPVLGDNVFVGAGARIIGPVRIGSDVKIGANAVVTKDLPDGATAVGIPARVIKIYGERVDASTPRREYALSGSREEFSGRTP